MGFGLGEGGKGRAAGRLVVGLVLFFNICVYIL